MLEQEVPCLAPQDLPMAQLKGLCPVQAPHLSWLLGSVTRAWPASAELPATPLE